MSPSISTPTAPRATVWHRCWRPSSPESISSIPTAGTSAGGTGAPAIELIYVFCKKLGIDTGVNMEAVAKINTQLQGDPQGARTFRSSAKRSLMPKPFNPLTDEASEGDRRRIRPGDQSSAGATTKRRCSTPATRSRPISDSRHRTNWSRRPKSRAACTPTWWHSSSSSRPRRFCPAPWS